MRPNPTAAAASAGPARCSWLCERRAAAAAARCPTSASSSRTYGEFRVLRTSSRELDWMKLLAVLKKWQR